MTDIHNPGHCPSCAYDLAPRDVCTHCGWTLPSPWVLLRLLDGARNYVADSALREEITRIVPPQPRDWPEWFPRWGAK